MKRILVAIDGSARAAYVLQTAAMMATQAGAKLILVRAVGIVPELPPGIENKHIVERSVLHRQRLQRHARHYRHLYQIRCRTRSICRQYAKHSRAFVLH